MVVDKDGEKRWRKFAIPVSIALVSLGCLSLFLLMSSGGFGPPGTSAYEAYEARSRLIPLPITLIAIGVVATYVHFRTAIGRLGHIALFISLSGAAFMILGNVAEFWFFTDLPYGVDNSRSTAWSLFLVGSALLLLGIAALAFAAARRRPEE
jgi:hypothetical protein